MEPQSRLLEFYKGNLVRFDHLRTLPNSFDKEIEKLFQDSVSAFPALKKLCENNKELMFGILQGFLTLYYSENKLMRQDVREYEKNKKRKKKNLQRDIENFIKGLTRESLGHIKRAKSLDLDINESKLIEKAKAWISYKAHLYLNKMDKYDDAINFVCMIDSDIDCGKLKKNMYDSLRSKAESNKTSVSFNDLLYTIYSTCKSRTELTDSAIFTQISNLLNSFEIKSKTGISFSPKNIQSIIKRSRSSPAR